jgi:hypothetical protein
MDIFKHMYKICRYYVQEVSYSSVCDGYTLLRRDMVLLVDFIMHCLSEITQQLSRKYIVVT